jgi:hypothetical protein
MGLDKEDDLRPTDALPECPNSAGPEAGPAPAAVDLSEPELAIVMILAQPLVTTPDGGVWISFMGRHLFDDTDAAVIARDEGPGNDSK